MPTKTITLTRGDEKKHSWVYVNKEEGVSFYIPKTIVGSGPERIKVTLEQA